MSQKKSATGVKSIFMYHIQNIHKILLLLFRISMDKIKKDHLFIIHILAAIIAVIVINDCDAQGKYVLFGKTLLAFNYICKMSSFKKKAICFLKLLIYFEHWAPFKKYDLISHHKSIFRNNIEISKTCGIIAFEF